MNYIDCIGPGILAQNSPHQYFRASGRVLPAEMLANEVARLRTLLTGARNPGVRHSSLVDNYDIHSDKAAWVLLVELHFGFKLKISLPPEALKSSLDDVSEAFLAPAVLAAFRAEYPGAFFDFRGW